MKRKKDDDGKQAALEDLTEHAVAAEIASELADEMGQLTVETVFKRAPAVPSVREVRALLDCAREQARDYLILRLFYYTGIRLAEMVELRFADVFDDGRVLVRQGKGDEDRYTLVDNRTLQLLSQWQGERPPSESVSGLHAGQVGHIVEEYGRRAGLVQKYHGMQRSFSPHSLRHAFATHRYDAGMDLATLQKLLGHRYLATTLLYVKTSMKHMQKQYRRTDPLRGKPA